MFPALTGAVTTNTALFDLCPVGFCTSTVRFARAVKSAAFSVIAQVAGELQNVLLTLPPSRTCDPGPGIVAAKLLPAMLRANPAAPALALEGRSERITGSVVIVTVAEAPRLVSSELVAITLKVLGVGATAGAT